MKVAIYARYSSDNQRDASIADQLRVCRAFAERQGWAICEEYTDHAVSGATLLRAGFQSLMHDALNRRFDVVLAEPPPLLHPEMAELFRQKVTTLAQELEHPETRTEATEALRGLIDAIFLTSGEGNLRIELSGNLAAMLSAATNAKRSPETGDLSPQVQMVAWACNRRYLQLCTAAA